MRSTVKCIEIFKKRKMKVKWIINAIVTERLKHYIQMRQPVCAILVHLHKINTFNHSLGCTKYRSNWVSYVNLKKSVVKVQIICMFSGTIQSLHKINSNSPYFLTFCFFCYRYRCCCSAIRSKSVSVVMFQLLVTVHFIILTSLSTKSKTILIIQISKVPSP